MTTRHLRTVGALGALSTALALFLGLAAAWACVASGSPGTLDLSTSRVRPGATVEVSGKAGKSSPVAIYLASGPVPLATVPVTPDNAGQGYRFQATVIVPALASPGKTALIANQDNVRWQSPITLLAEGDGPDAAPPGGSAATSASGGFPSWGPGVTAVVAMMALAAAIGVRQRRLRRAEEEPQTTAA